MQIENVVFFLVRGGILDSKLHWGGILQMMPCARCILLRTRGMKFGERLKWTFYINYWINVGKDFGEIPREPYTLVVGPVDRRRTGLLPFYAWQVLIVSCVYWLNSCDDWENGLSPVSFRQTKSLSTEFTSVLEFARVFCFIITLPCKVRFSPTVAVTERGTVNGARRN